MALLFIQTIESSQLNTTPPPTQSSPCINIYTDNLEVVTRAQDSKNYDHQSKFYPISNEITHLTKKIHASISWNWVKGHSDEDSLPHHLNHLADYQAQKRRQSSSPSPKWPFHSTNSGILSFNDLPILNTPSLLKIQTTENLLVYYTQKWNLSLSSLVLIDWTSFSYAINNFSSHQTNTISKISAGWLPINLHLNKIENSTDKCPICTSAPESISHMFQCSSQLSNKKKLINALKKRNIDPAIIDSIIHLALNNDTQKLLQKYSTQPYITTAILQQSQLGSQHILHGKISQCWHSAQCQYAQHHPSPSFQASWPIQFINSLLTFSLQLWKTRNDFNNQSQNPTSSSNIGKTNSQIKLLYHTKATKVLNIDNHLFLPSLTSLLAYTPLLKSQWILSVNIASEAYEHHKQSLYSHQPLISSFFSKIPHQSQPMK